MSGASWKNVLPRKINKERSQPSHRKKHGLLEKKKDYVLRARDYQKKKTLITNLRRKAAFKNPDEFYFAMNKTKTKEGVHQVERATDHLPHEYIQLLKTQDLAYVHMKKALDEKKAEKLRSNLHLLTNQPVNKHTVFVEKPEDAEDFDPAVHFGTVPEMVDRAYNRVRVDQLEQEEVQGVATMKELKKVRRQREQSYKELQERTGRTKKLDQVIERMMLEKNVMGKGRKRKVKEAEDGKPPVYQWKRERAR